MEDWLLGDVLINGNSDGIDKGCSVTVGGSIGCPLGLTGGWNDTEGDLLGYNVSQSDT